MLWHYLKNRRACGPIGDEEIRRMALGGQIQPDDFVWREGWDGWRRASTAAELWAPVVSARAIPLPDPAARETAPQKGIDPRMGGAGQSSFPESPLSSRRQNERAAQSVERTRALGPARPDASAQTAPAFAADPGPSSLPPHRGDPAIKPRAPADAVIAARPAAKAKTKAQAKENPNTAVLGAARLRPPRSPLAGGEPLLTAQDALELENLGRAVAQPHDEGQDVGSVDFGSLSASISALPPAQSETERKNSAPDAPPRRAGRPDFAEPGFARARRFPVASAVSFFCLSLCLAGASLASPEAPLRLAQAAHALAAAFARGVGPEEIDALRAPAALLAAGAAAAALLSALAALTVGARAWAELRDCDASRAAPWLMTLPLLIPGAAFVWLFPYLAGWARRYEFAKSALLDPSAPRASVAEMTAMALTLAFCCVAAALMAFAALDLSDDAPGAALGLWTGVLGVAGFGGLAGLMGLAKMASCSRHLSQARLESQED